MLEFVSQLASNPKISQCCGNTVFGNPFQGQLSISHEVFLPQNAVSKLIPSTTVPQPAFSFVSMVHISKFHLLFKTMAAFGPRNNIQINFLTGRVKAIKYWVA